MQKITFKKAKNDDLHSILNLLFEDDLGKSRESISEADFCTYQEAFKQINEDKNQFLLIGEIDEKIIACAQLTKIANLTFKGAARLQVEGVRVAKNLRGQKIGQQMMEEIKDFARKNDCKIIQLTTNVKRKNIVEFYEKCGFENSHFGMKLYLND
jgi:GNAT superfamily N-acetyltransferase